LPPLASTFSSTPTPLRSPPTLRSTFKFPNQAPRVHQTNHINRAADKHAATTDAYKVDTDKYPTAKAYFGIETLPTVVVYKDGKELKKVEGINEENAKEIAAILV
jgi:thioredoxin-like negative regulator of GroEL